MPKHVVFFVHGMGTHDKTWHEEGLKVLSNAWEDYQKLKDRDLGDLIEAVPVVYDDVFTSWRDHMKSDYASFKTALLGGIAPEDQSYSTAVSNRLDKIGNLIGAGDDNFGWTHAADVILYRFNMLAREAVDAKVLDQIMTRVKQGNFVTWSIVAHSLGTSVTHNSINSLYGAGLGNIAPLSPSETRPRCIMMVANVSRVLERPGARVYTSLVKPGKTFVDRACGYYLNVRHTLDPFMKPRPFDRQGWPDPATYVTDRYQHIQPGHVLFTKSDLLKVHDFAHYLKNPRVHVPLFRALLDHDIIPDDELTHARAQFDAAQIQANVEEVTKALESLMPAQGKDWGAIIDLILKLTRS